MSYTRVNWLNEGEAGAKPINKTNLNIMDQGIKELDTNITATKIWENSSPDANFPAQVVNLSALKKGFLIVYFADYCSNQKNSSIIVPVTDDIDYQIATNFFFSSTLFFSTRNFTPSLKNKNISFDNNVGYSVGNIVAQHNDWLIPTSIYLIPLPIANN